MLLLRWGLAVALVVAASACRPEFQLKRFPTTEGLYEASLRQFERRKWDNAITGFEKLTTDLSPRDTLLSRSYWYLARARQERDEWLLASQSFQRLVDAFPDDTLADDAALEAARSYRHLWRKPTLDAQYGETALASYRQFLGLYPASPLAPQGEKEINELEEWFAKKNYETGLYYLRRKAYDSAILYFRGVRDTYPNSPSARDAGLRMAEAFGAIKWREDRAEVCNTLREKYPADREVRLICGAAPAANGTAPPDTTKPPAR
jgi:outer membrane protein assembly factor BamD